MAAVTPIRSVASVYESMSADDIGKLGSKGYGSVKFKQFVSDIRELCRLAQIAEKAIAEGRRYEDL